MKTHACLRFTLVVVAASWCTDCAFAFGPGEAAGRAPAEKVDFKVLVWYRLQDPLGTFKYQVYDVRKGEYTRAVDAWVKEMRAKYPSYVVAVRDVNLQREKGATEQLKVGAVIQRDLAVAAASAGILPSAPITVSVGPVPSGSAPALGQSRSPGIQIDRRDYANPPTSGFPIPVPYPRLPR